MVSPVGAGLGPSSKEAVVQNVCKACILAMTPLKVFQCRFYFWEQVHEGKQDYVVKELFD